MSKRFGLIGVALILAMLVVPSGAGAANFTISNPANGSFVNSLPVPPSTPDVIFSGGYDWTSAPSCDYTGGSLLSGDAICTDSLLERPATNGTADGTYSLKVSGTVDNGGPPVGEFDNSTFTLDTIDPVVLIASPANHTQLAQKRPTVHFTATDANALTHDCFLSPGSVAWEPCGSATSYTPAFDLADGSYSLQVRATDAAGNEGFAAALFTVDNTAPTVNVIYPTAGAIVDSSVPEINMAVDGATGGSFCRYDAQEYQSCAASWLGGSLTDGAHTLSVRAVDVAGNETVVVVPFFVDDSLASGPLPQSVSLTNSKGTKVKRGKFKVKAGLSVLPSDLNFIDRACTGSVTFAIKPKGGKSISKRTTLKRSGDRCSTSGSITLPAKYKGKRGTLTARYHGSMLISSFRRTRAIKKL